MDNNQENNIKDNENPVVTNKRYGRNKLETFDWLVDVPAVGTKQCNLVEVQFKNTRKGYYLNSLKPRSLKRRYCGGGECSGT